MKVKVVNAFVLNNKTYFPGNEIDSSIFSGVNESILNNFLKIGFLIPLEKKVAKVAPPPVKEKKHFVAPAPIEIKNNVELQKVVEGPKPEAVTPPVQPPPQTIPVQPPTQQRGRAKRS